MRGPGSRSAPLRRRPLFLSVTVLALLLAGRDRAGAATVRGILQVPLRIGSPAGPADVVPVAQATVYLRTDPPTAWEGQHALTDDRGSFALPLPSPGAYRLHWERPGFLLCGGQTFTVATTAIDLGKLTVRPEGIALAGRLTLVDGGAPRFLDPFLGSDARATVELRDGLGAPVAPAAAIDGRGRWVMGSVPAGTWDLVSTLEEASVTTSVTISAAPSTSCLDAEVLVQEQVEQTLPNQAPHLETVLARDSNGVLRGHVAPGSTITVEARATDADADYLHYDWKLSSDGYGQTLTPVPVPGRPPGLDNPKLAWRLPDVAGVWTLNLRLSDSRGGYDKGQASVSVGSTLARFSGTVRDQGGAPLADATVWVNQQSTTTDTDGYFAIKASEGTPYFAVVVDKKGYAPSITLHPGEATHESFVLPSEVAATVSSTLPIDVTLQQGGQPVARVQIPGGSFKTTLGQPVSGPVTLRVARYDVHSTTAGSAALPGLLTTTDAKGIAPLVALSLRATDSTEQPVHLSTSIRATVTVPLPAGLVADPALFPRSGLAVHTVQKHSGRWAKEPFDDAIVVLPGDPPISDPPSFPAPFARLRPPIRPIDPVLPPIRQPPVIVPIRLQLPTCVTIDVDTDRLRLGEHRVRLSYRSAGADLVDEFDLPTDPTVIDSLPADTPITYEVLDAAGRVLPQTKQIVSSGPPFLCFNFPGFDCTCPNKIFLSQAPDPANDPPAEFLSRFLTVNLADAQEYYARVDPTSAKTTLEAWRTANGFDGTQTPGIYFNDGDLQFGRRMSALRQSPDQIAFYVKNFLSAEAAADNNPDEILATVAMDWSSVPGVNGGQPFLKFFVYNTFGDRVAAADLDGAGAKFVPGLCIVCHGTYEFIPGANPDNVAAIEARYLPFDLDAFFYAKGYSAYTRANQEGTFRDFNSIIHGMATGGSSTSTRELIEAWYGGATLPSAEQDSNAVVPGWDVDPPGPEVDQAFARALYLDTIKPSCRGCHITRNTALEPPPNLDWASYDLFHAAAAGTAVCGFTMPHAKATYNSFWLEDARRERMYEYLDRVFSGFGGAAGLGCPTFTED